ncbi:MAG: D-glycero-beta-D-manno-heptose 1,7-bisphosphate 7-phosphatase [Methylococcaceae bacterium]|nr:D-glycero-beta-D-manno-heptose 1,7-bisphosphate 7-phosphatase [Methylococcaceae bacterium]
MALDRYVLLDRDGVINHDSDLFIKSPEEWQPIPGSLEAIALLNEHDFQVVVISNQSGLARGLFDLAVLKQIHAKMLQMVEEKGGNITAIYYCPHSPDDQCHCRKPKPGMLETFAREHRVDLRDTVLVGDSIVDVLAAQAAGAKPLLVKTGKGLKTLINHPDLNIPIFDNLYDAAKHITSRR